MAVTAPATGADAVALARRQLGTPYEWGQESPAAGFDCSGLVQYIFGQLGVRLPRVSHDQAGAGAPVPLDQIQPGDLIFSDWEGSPNSHVAIYAGNGRLIEAPQAGDVVHEIPLSAGYLRHVDQARRVIGAGGAGGAPGGALGAAAGGAGGDPEAFGLGSIPGAGAIADAVKGVGSAIGRISDFFGALLWITQPRNVLRVLVGTAGGLLIALGIGFLAILAARG